MKVEILHIESCPNWQEAGRRLNAALIDTGHDDVTINFRLIRTAGDAAGSAFAGSPTILVDGTDLFPGTGTSDELACRLYITPHGLAGVPTPDQLLEGIRARGN